jgi:hypothetical protein
MRFELTLLLGFICVSLLQFSAVHNRRNRSTWAGVFAGLCASCSLQQVDTHVKEYYDAILADNSDNDGNDNAQNEHAEENPESDDSNDDEDEDDGSDSDSNYEDHEAVDVEHGDDIVPPSLALPAKFLSGRCQWHPLSGCSFFSGQPTMNRFLRAVRNVSLLFSTSVMIP